MQLELCLTALSFRVIKTSPGLGATLIPKEASLGGGGGVGRRTNTVSSKRSTDNALLSPRKLFHVRKLDLFVTSSKSKSKYQRH